jgi:hypothetical protein
MERHMFSARIQKHQEQSPTIRYRFNRFVDGSVSGLRRPH